MTQYEATALHFLQLIQAELVAISDILNEKKKGRTCEKVVYRYVDTDDPLLDDYEEDD